MGKIIFKFDGKSGKPFIYIKRSVDNIETQEIRMTLSNDAFLSTESGYNINLSGKDKDYNIVEINIPISIEELKEALKEV